MHYKTPFSDKKDLRKFKNFSSSLPPAIRSKGITEIKWEKRELSFHPHFNYEGFIYLQVEYCESVR